MQRRNAWLATGFALAGVALAACGTTHDISLAGTRQEPATVQPIQGTDRSRIVLSAASAERLGVVVEPVRDAAGSPTIPAPSLFYDKNGSTWVYVRSAPLTYEREAVSVARMAGDVAVLKSGPAPGTLVVTVGGIELYGTETGVSGG
jgi:hypothetical protein